MKKDHPGINPASKPSGDVMCGMPGVPNRLVALTSAGVRECGHIGCCDTFRVGMHPSMRPRRGIRSLPASAPVRDWFYDYEKQAMIKGVELLPPHAHPPDQPSPGPAGRVPANFESLRH